MLRNSKYTHRLTREQMLETANPSLKNIGIDYSKDNVTDNAFRSLYMDAIRNVIINNKKFITKSDDIKDADIANFKEWLITNNEITKENIDKLESHYSQAPMVFTGGCLYNYCNMNVQEIFWSEPVSTACHIYEKNGDIYFTIKTDNYPISTMDKMDVPLGHIKGPVDVLFKLTEKGFELQHVSTNSELLQDMYLGKEISRERILNNVLENNIREQVLKSLNSAFINLIENEKALRSIPKTKMTSQPKSEHSALNKGLAALADYKNNKIDILALQKALADVKLQINSAHSRAQSIRGFFSRTAKPTSKKIMDEVLNKIKVIKKKETAAFKHMNSSAKKMKK